MKHLNRRNKTSDMLFKIVEYGGIAFGINTLLPESLISFGRALIVLGGLALILIAALIITPEKEDE
ncbi:MAG TPA: hypothetical protein DCQ99_05175 [Nitrospinae bacterium]|nr:hypothetical protein [Nitrospinota bacterium]